MEILYLASECLFTPPRPSCKDKGIKKHMKFFLAISADLRENLFSRRDAEYAEKK